MYGEPEKKDKAKEHKHMTFLEAADMAKRAQVKKDVAYPLQSVTGASGGIYGRRAQNISGFLCGKGRMDPGSCI